MSVPQSNSCACVAVRIPPGDVLCFDVSHCSQMNGHMESRVRWGGGGRVEALDMLKDTCGAPEGGPCLIDRVLLQVAVISVGCGEVQWSQSWSHFVVVFFFFFKSLVSHHY